MHPVRGVLAKAVALLVVLGTLLLGGALPAAAVTAATPAAATPAAATPAAASDRGALPASDRAWFGPDLDWGDDGPDGYAGRLGAVPSMYGVEIEYPFDRSARKEFLRATRAAAAQGAVLVVSLEPSQSLGSLTRADAETANRLFEEVHRQYDTRVLVRFAPQMNGTWVRWGQQPTAFVDAFRTLARVVHAGDSSAAMVWSPSYGAGYPFGESAGRLQDLSATDVSKLDTNGDGQLTAADDPYAPYWPGASSVDWVGLSMFSFGKGKATEAAGREVPLTTNEVPAAGEVQARFDETWGYQQPQTEGTFTQRFAVDQDRPMLLDTGALYDHSLEGAAELPVKQEWWRQVIAAVQQHPEVRGVTFLETNRREPEAGNRVADWRDTAVPGSPGRSAPTCRTPTTSSSGRSPSGSHRRTAPPPSARSTRPAATRWRGSSGWRPVWRRCSCSAASSVASCRAGATPTTASPGATCGSTCSAASSSSPSSSRTSRSADRTRTSRCTPRARSPAPRCSCSCPAWSSA